MKLPKLAERRVYISIHVKIAALLCVGREDSEREIEGSVTSRVAKLYSEYFSMSLHTR